MIVEGMLFVGNAEGKSLPAAKIASHIRNVSADEIDQIVGELNAAYRQDETAYEIVGDSAGYRLQLRSDLGILRDQFRGQQRAAKLTPAAIEVLSIVAYRQGVSGEELNKLRGSQSHAILAQLVRRHLVRVERAKEGSARGPLPHNFEVQSAVRRQFRGRPAAERRSRRFMKMTGVRGPVQEIKNDDKSFIKNGLQQCHGKPL